MGISSVFFFFFLQNTMEESRHDQCYEGCHGKEDDNQRGSEKVQCSLQVCNICRDFMNLNFWVRYDQMVFKCYEIKSFIVS